MKKLLCILLTLVMLAGCAAGAPGTEPASADEVLILLSDEGVEFPEGSGVHTANDILCDGANTEDAARHTVVHINAPGTYVLSGKLDAGQIAVDLGEDAKDDPNAVVTLVLDNAEIACSVAPAVIFYNVYESSQPGGPAGAHVILAEASRNQIIGSHTEDYDGALYSRMSRFPILHSDAGDSSRKGLRPARRHGPGPGSGTVPQRIQFYPFCRRR